ncbi:STAS domain-containing protein [Nonomuraea sp. NPDC050536]|uniref:STAS domain-containing protein n=1 Tax=Nonomuraea sp. NPDC050536 TaxID=3364366 RepID=UPI0037CC1B71
MTTLAMTCQQLRTGALISVTGEVDITTSAHLQSAIKEGRRPGEPLILDLGGVTFLDSTGLSVLLDAHTAAERDGGSLHLADVQRLPMRVFQITGVLPRLHLHTTVGSALATLIEAGQRVAANDE